MAPSRGRSEPGAEAAPPGATRLPPPRATATPTLPARRTRPAARGARPVPPPLRAEAGAGIPKIDPSTGKAQMLVYVPPHPLVKHWVAVARNKDTPSPIFRSALAELGRILVYEAARDWLPTVQGQVETPLALADVEVVDTSRPVKVVPILRAGLTLLEDVATVLPAQQTFHLGVAR